MGSYSFLIPHCSSHASASATIPRSKRYLVVKNIDFRDWALRALVVACGAVAAALLVLRGQAQAIAPLALGAMLGAAMMSQIGPSEE
jgi:uncharacterized membrane protein YfcA